MPPSRHDSAAFAGHDGTVRARRDPVVSFVTAVGAVMLVVGGLAVLSLAGCRGIGFAHVVVPSPDGLEVAVVRRGVSIDPPLHTLWLQDRASGIWTHLVDLAEDQDWCNTVVWSDDGTQVAFLVQDARALVFDADSGALVLDRWLVADDAYPPSRRVVGLSFAAEGRSIRYRDCPRVKGQCSEVEGFELPVGAPAS